MNVNDPADPLFPPSHGGRHTSARERQRRGPMWGCLKALIWIFGGVFLFLLVGVGGGWWYLGSSNFADYVRKKIEANLESHLERDVTIERVTFDRSRPQKIIIHNLRIANDPRATSRDFALVREVQITGGVASFWGRDVKVDRVDVRDPQLFFEVFPDGTHNFPKWKTGPRRRFEIVHVNVGKLFITNGAFTFHDQKHDIAAAAQKIESTVTVTRAEDLYAGIMNSPLVRVRIQDYVPFDVTMRGGFRYTPGVLELQSIALRGRGIDTFLSGRLDPLTEGAYDLKLASRIELARVREIFRVEETLDGTFVLDSHLKGNAGEFALTGGWTSPHIAADAYELTSARGRLDVNGNNLTVDVEHAGYGGGTIGAHYVLSTYAEPYPMNVDLRYTGISIEQLFSDWTVENTGLRAAATGTLNYRWNKDDILDGNGEGRAKLAKNATAFSKAKYPIPVAGTTDFALNKGVVTFRSMELDTDQSHVSLTGSLRIEDLDADLRMAIRSSDFAELDRIGYNFAQSADKKDYTLLGFGGAGTINGTVKGPIETPKVVATVAGTQVRYNEVLLGDANIDLRHDGNRSVLTFDRAVFTDANGRLALNGTVAFPEVGEPRFDLAVEANGYPAQRTIDAVDLDLLIGEGLATGKMLVAGTPETGRATFVNTVIRRAESTLALNGAVNWLPGEGNVAFDLDIAATSFPVADIAKFLELADLPVTGELTGILKIAGRKESLEGSGSVTVRNGAIQGEPIDLASADLVFTQGRLRATSVLVKSAAGEIRGDAEADLANERFSYTIASSSLDLSKLKSLESLRGILGGTITINSTGAGTFTQPELVLEATLQGTTLRGQQLPAGSAPPSIYLAIRSGRLIVRGAIADIVAIEGEGTLGENLAVDGTVRISVSDIARAVALSPMTASLPAAGNLVIDMKLGGRLTPLEALVVEATAPVFNFKFADQEFTAPEPLRVSLRNGRMELDSFALRRVDSVFAVTGFAEITGAKRLDIDVRGRVEAALLQLFMRDVRAEGHTDVSMSITGTMSAPRILGTAELVEAQIKFAGFPQLIDEINGTLRFRGDRIEIESIRATVGGGQVVAGGFIGVAGMTPSTVRITLQGSDVALRAYQGLTLEGNFTLLLTGGLDRAMLQGDVDVTRALYFRDFDFQQTLLDILLARSRVTTVSSATWQDRVGLNIHLDAQDTLAVRNNIAEVTGSATLDVTGTVANPVILGEVTLNEGGSVRIQNVDYQVARGTIAFQNPFRIDPFFDVTIEGTVSGFGASETESGPYEVTVNLTGTLDRLTPTITSDPPASDITLFSILGFGGIGSRDSSQQAGGIGAYGQSLLYQSIGSLIGSRVFPFVDSFAYDPGTLDTGTGAGPRVTFEKRLSNKVRFIVVYNLDDNQSKQVIEWLVNPSWTLQLTRDESDEYRIDARFRRRYDAHWEFGNDELRNIADAAVMRPEGSGQVPAPRPSAPPVTAVNPRAADDQPIAQIHFRADAGFDTSTLAQEVTLRPGQPVTIRELQSSIKNLFATGNFRDIRVDATPADDGVVVTFSLFLHYRVGDIVIDGISGGDRARARRELTVRTGEILSLDDVDDSANAIQQTLEHMGFLQATVDPETNFDRARNTADVHFYATPGPLAIIASVILEGNPAPFTPAEVMKSMKRREGKSFQINEAREDANRMQNFFVRRDHRRARVELLGQAFDETTHGVTLRYRAVAGPIVKVEVAGVPRTQVRRWLPFARNQEYSEDAVDQAADDIVRGLQERGHYLAAVDTESELQNNVWTTTFRVSPGPRFRVADVKFSGNIEVREKDLQKLVATTTRGGFRRALASLFRRPTGVTHEQIGDDRDNVESYYRLQGFSEATVDTPAVVTNDAAGTLSVTFPITEGPQTLVTDVRIEGVSEHHDMPQPQLAAGKPLSPQLLHDDVVALQTYYANSGHIEVQVAPRVQVSDDKTRATVAYVVTEGPHIEVDEVIVRGNTYTDSDVVLRKAGLESGDPFSYTGMLEAQRDLYRLGIFQRVDVQPEQAGTSVGDRDIVITVEEGKNLTLTGAVGLRVTRGDQGGTATPDPTPENPTDTSGGMEVHERVSIAAAHRNLFGSGRYLGLELVGGREEREAFLTYREPFISPWNIPVQFQVFQSDDRTRPGTQIRQRGASIEAAKVARLQTRWSLRYEYKISECLRGEICKQLASDVPIDPSLDPALRDIQISSITPTFFWDRRDDIIDPHRGFFTSASVEYAFPFLSAKAGFLKEYLQGAYYLPIGGSTVLALSGRIGFIQPYAKKQNSDDLLGVPLSERFTAGGETTHRAFALDRLGNVCEDPREPLDCEATLVRSNGRILPLGGNSLLLANAEYRFPIFGPVGGAVFMDIGNVFAGSKIKFDQLRYGGGFGFRYLSPVGPLRIDFAMPVRPYSWEDKYQYFITLGYAF